MTASDPTQLANLIKAVADPLRLQILRQLGDSSYAVLELCHIFDLRQSGMSHHLKVLANAGWVETRREGNSIFYRRALPSGPVQAVMATIFRQADELAVAPAQQQRLEQVYQERYALAQSFFDRNADRFAEQQDLIASYETYADTAAELLFSQSDRSGKRNLVIEIGPGRGEFIQRLSQHFDQVIGADISGDMLEQAGKYCQQHEINNVSLRQCNSQQLGELEGQANALVYNMVLHHVPEPADEFRQSARLLAPGGLMLVTDLCLHDQDWAHESCGDLWLGFDEPELHRWARHAGLVPMQTTYVGLRNGFQIQCLLFQKPDTGLTQH